MKRRPVSLSPNIGGVEQLVLQHEITESMLNISGIVNSKSNFGLLVVPEVGGPSGQPSPIPTLKRSLSSKQLNEPRTIPTLSPETVTPRTTTSEQSKSFGHANNIRNSVVSLKIVEDYEKGQLPLQESQAPKGIRKSLKQLALFVMGESVEPAPAMPIIGVELSGHEHGRLASIKDTATTAKEDNLNSASAKKLQGIITMGRTSKTRLVFSNNELRTSQTSPKGRPKILMLAPNTPKVPVLPSEFATLKFTKGTIKRSGSLTSPNNQPSPMTLHAPLSSGRISKRRFSSSGKRKKSFGPASVKSFEDVTTPMSPAGKFIQRLDQLKEWLHARKADETYLECRVMKGYNLKYQGKVFDEEQILSELNPWLRQEILLFGCEDILKSVPFFQRDEDDGRNELLFRTIAELLERTSFSPGECICKQNDCGDEMYFLLEGRVSIMKDGVFMGYVEEGSYFGGIIK
ncbi:anaphase-promoting complex subunit Hcn1 [Rhizoclosmatium hyalinum]|nr:anaphase-promoting complex subunit Hcn1 [Rhizoclosmatium hyalinum]